MTQNISTWYEKICATTDYQNVEFSEDIRLNIENWFTAYIFPRHGYNTLSLSIWLIEKIVPLKVQCSYYEIREESEW